MPRHGFAMRRPWRLAEWGCDHDSARCTCILEDDEQTRRLYPFAFSLELTYTLRREALSCLCRVRGGSNSMPFSIGNHLSLKLPFTDTGTFAEITLQSPARAVFGLTPWGFLDGSRRPLDLRAGRSIADDLLLDAVIGDFAGGEFRVSLVDPTSFSLEVSQRPGDERSRERMKPEDTFFVLYGDTEQTYFCPEPWHGRPNSLNTLEGAVILDRGDEFAWEMVIERRTV